MMGMFQMFMMNQTIGMQQQQPQGPIPQQINTQQPTVNHSQSKPPTPSHPGQNNHSDSNILQMSNTSMTPQLTPSQAPSQLKQSQSAMNVTPGLSSYPHSDNITKSRSYQDEDNHHLQPNHRSSVMSDSDEETDNPMSDVEEGPYGSQNRSHSRSRKKRHKDKKERDKERERKERKREKKEKKKKEKKRKKEREKEKERQKRGDTESIPIFDEKDMDINVPPPPSQPFPDQSRYEYELIAILRILSFFTYLH